ncbi:hypothetical protein BKA70DRAFT_794441 [Coprinopsis sp. MPI-PUGE-AT-0042]|nr:hypothetical protein BKA70DRAFT_794441 [Coprinopsis sp. MPI-PUGE-AT-0042]
MRLPKEKHSSSGKSQLRYSKQLALLAVWTISPASVASMVSRQLPDASFLLTSMDHLSRSVIGVGSLAGKNRKLTIALTPEEDVIPSSTFLLAWIRHLFATPLASALFRATATRRAFQAYLTDGKCKKTASSRLLLWDARPIVYSTPPAP